MSPSFPLRALDLLLAHPVARLLREACGAAPAHLVGGILRDRFLGQRSNDFDAVVSGRGREIAENLQRTLPARLVFLGGKAFAAYRLVGNDFTLDLWDRGEMTVAADLERRDFTVNAMALDLRREAGFLDPHRGLEDLRRRVLRAVNARSFSGDPLRVLRLPRLLLQLPGFAAEPETVAWARAAAPRLPEIAVERVREEIRMILEHDEAHRGVAMLALLGLYPGLWLGRPGEIDFSAGHAIAELERLESCARLLATFVPPDGSTPDLAAARAALLCVHLPAGSDPRAALKSFAAAGYLARRTADAAAALLRLPALPQGDLAPRHFLADAGELWATAACFLGARESAAGRGSRWENWLEPIADLLRREGPEILDPPALLKGEEVAALLGVGPGPAIGRALAALRRAQIEGKIKTREEALAALTSKRGVD